MVGADGGSSRVPGARKMIFFSKVVPRPFGMLKQVFLARFEPMVTRFGPRKYQNALKMAILGPKMGQKWVKSVLCQK